MQKIDINYMSKKLRMAKSTVSKAMNDRSDVSMETKEKVRFFAKKINYRPNPFAQALNFKKSRIIGVVMHELKRDFFTDIAKGIIHEGSRQNYRTVFASSDGSREKEKEILVSFMDGVIDGVILIPTIDHNNAFLRFFAGNNKVVVVDNFVKGLPAPFVGTDFAEGAYQSCMHIIKKGHKEIGYLGGPLSLASSNERIEGLKKAFKDSSLKFTEKNVIHGEYDSSDARKNIRRLLETNKKITAVICANVDISQGAYEEIIAMGKKVPDDISLVDFGSTRFFSSVDQKAEETGRIAARLICQLIENNKEKVNKKNIIKPEFICRDSVQDI